MIYHNPTDKNREIEMDAKGSSVREAQVSCSFSTVAIALQKKIYWQIKLSDKMKKLPSNGWLGCMSWPAGKRYVASWLQ